MKIKHKASPQASKTRAPLVGFVSITPALVVVLMMFIIPIGLMAWMSLFDWPLLGGKQFVGLDNYVRAFTRDATFVQSIIFTLIYTVIVTPVLFIAGLGLAFFIRRKTKWSGIFRTVFFTPYVIGFAAASFLWLWFINDSVGPIAALSARFNLDLNQTSWLIEKWPALISVIIMVTWKVVGFQMIMLLSGLNGVPDEVIEAAQIDGAGWWRRLFGVILPLMKPTIIMVLVFSISGSLLAFEQFFLITKGRPDNETVTAVYWIYNAAFTKFELGYGAALSIIMLVLLVIVAWAQIRILRDPEEQS